MTNTEVNLMDALYRSVEQVAGKDAADRLGTLPLPKEPVHMPDYEAIWEDRMVNQYGFAPQNHRGEYR